MPNHSAATLRDLFGVYESKRLRSASPGTGAHYYTAIDHFREFLGNREPTIDDLFDERVTTWMHALVERRAIVAETAVSYVKKILALWRFACRHGHCTTWPEIELLQCPQRDPIAWTEPEVRILFQALRS